MKGLLRLPLLPILLVAIGLFAPTVVSGKTLFWGTPLLQFIPWWSFAWESLRSFHLPLWNPWLGMGAPLVANYQIGLFYPPNWMYGLFYLMGGVKCLAWGQAILVALHLIWAGVGMAKLVRRLGLGELSQAVGGLAFGFCGYLVARGGFLSINATVAWLPWVIFYLTPDYQTHRQPTRWNLGLILCLGMQLLAGHAQTTWYTWLLAALWVCYWAWQRGAPQLEPSSPPSRKRSPSIRNLMLALGGLGVAILLACGLAALQLLPTAEYLLQSQRSMSVDRAYALNYSFWSWRLLTFFAPELFGNPADGDYWGYGNYWEDAIYIGLLPILLALGSLMRTIRPSRKALAQETAPTEKGLPTLRPSFGRFLFLLTFVAILLALGKNTPLYPWLYDHVPTFDMFQAPTRFMLWAEFGLVLLACLGVEQWRRPEKRGLYWTRLGTAGAFAVTLGAGLAWETMGDISPSFIRATALAGLWGVGVGVLSLTAPPREPSQPQNLRYLNIWSWCVALLVALDLFIANWGLNPHVELRVLDATPLTAQVQDILKGHRLFLPEADEYDLKFKRFLKFSTFHPGEDWSNLRAVLLPNITMLDHISSVNNFDPLLPGRYVRWMGFLSSADEGLRQKLLNLMDVGAIERKDPPSPWGVRFEVIHSSQRARWVPCARFVTDGETAWNLIVAGQVDLEHQVILEAAPPPGESECPPGVNLPLGSGGEYPEVQIGMEMEGPNRIKLEVDAPASGWVLLSDVFYPGWRAWVDGKPVQVLRADYLFRAVALEAGRHRVEFSYSPLSFWLGCLISLCAWCGWLYLWVRGRRAQP